MSTQPLFDARVPTHAEIEAAIRRAHRERAQAFRRFLGALFSRPKVSTAEPAQAAHPDAVAYR